MACSCNPEVFLDTGGRQAQPGFGLLERDGGSSGDSLLNYVCRRA